MIVVIPVFTVTIGLFLAADGLSGRDALADGPVGTFTATDKTCGRGSCSLEGTFTSDDGTITRRGVDLRDAMRVGSGDPLPPPIDDVRLDTGASRPTAYTADYSWGWAVVAGAGITVVGPVFSVGLAVGTRRYQARALAGGGR